MYYVATFFPPKKQRENLPPFFGARLEMQTIQSFAGQVFRISKRISFFCTKASSPSRRMVSWFPVRFYDVSVAVGFLIVFYRWMMHHPWFEVEIIFSSFPMLCRKILLSIGSVEVGMGAYPSFLALKRDPLLRCEASLRKRKVL